MSCSPKVRAQRRLVLPGIVRCVNCGCQVVVHDACHCGAVNSWKVDPHDPVVVLQASVPLPLEVSIDYDTATDQQHLRPVAEKIE